jgi:hypothetical protein
LSQKWARNGILAAALGFALAIAVPGAAAAAPSHALEFAAGEACTFSLAIDVDAAGKRVTQEHNGVMVSTGTGGALTFINLATGESVSFRSNGAVQIAEPAGGGRTTLTLDGHNVVILFPSDTTAGPSTTLHIGRVVISVVDRTGNFTVLSSSGTTVDICAALS